MVTEILTSHISLSNGSIASLLSHDVCANVIIMETLTNVAAFSARTDVERTEYKALQQRVWKKSKQKELEAKVKSAMVEVKGTLLEISGIAIPVAAHGMASGTSRTVFMKTELLKEAVLRFHCLDALSVDLSRHIRV